jgi:pimeloyl-ACP methyl ester carboxylesterase
MRLSRNLILLVLTLVLGGCAPFDWYRKNTATCSDPVADILPTKCRANAVQVLAANTAADPGYSLGFIEFDDQGQLWSRQQMWAVLKSVSAQTADYLLVVYVHGWKHNAGWSERAGDDPDVTHFRAALQELSATEIALSRKSEAQGIARTPRQVVGVFMGWRGASITVPVIENLTFWDRKSTAHKVGHGELTEVLDRLEAIRQERLKDHPESLSRMIVVGHSFGGAVVFSALEQILESRFVQSAGTPENPAAAQGFGNLVVLLNPAFEAQLYSPLSDMTGERKDYADKQLPVLAILTSEADDATGVAFPIGRWFDTRFEKQRVVKRTNPATGQEEAISQKSADIRTVGHFAPYETHTLRGTTAAASPGTAQDAARIAHHNAQLLGQAAADWEQDAPGKAITFPGSVLTRTNNSVGRNPYLVVNVDKNLIRNHNDIWGDGIRQFITNLILISSQSENPQERRQRREAITK